MPGQCCSNTPTPVILLRLCYDWPINCPLGIKPLRTIIAFADPIADPIGSWENNIKLLVFLGWRLLWTGNFCPEGLDPTIHGYSSCERQNMAHTNLELNSFFFLGDSPLAGHTPGTVLVGEDVDNLLLQLVGCDMVSAFGSSDQVVTHLLFFPSISSILGTMGLKGKDRKKFKHLWI